MRQTYRVPDDPATEWQPTKAELDRIESMSRAAARRELNVLKDRSDDWTLGDLCHANTLALRAKNMRVK